MELDPGYIEDGGQAARAARWVLGPPKVGAFGGLKRKGRAVFLVDVYRCRQCLHLELFAAHPG
ncbi:hypothetical protein GCM10010191_22750 [Actinomadura vinacea]|uniref:Uncharacterized protein n=1 Tax=Actinomadura vinacea TaxID=115336 RepID=A0ABP5VY56_9ACTN